MDKIERDDTIDLGALFSVMAEKKGTCLAIVFGCALLGLVLALVLPKTYESTALVQTKSANKLDVTGASAALAMLGIGGGGGAGSSPMTYIEMMKSRAVLEPVMEQVDMDSDEREAMTAEKFAKKRLEIKNTKGTNLIAVKAKGKTPEEAQQISQGVVDNFLLLMTNLNRSEQSTKLKLL